MAKKNIKNGEEFSASLKEGLKYPWQKASRLLWILLVFLPIFGWFALIGYSKKIIKTLVEGQRKELPAFGGFWKNFKEGFIVFIFMIPTIIAVGIIGMIPFVGSPASLIINIFIMPWLVINFMVKGTFDSLWEIKRCFNAVFDHAKDYLWAYLKTFVFGLIYGLLMLVLVGIPCHVFGGMYFLTEFYKKYK